MGDLRHMVIGPGTQSGGAFDHILIILLEKQYRGYVLGNPYMRRLARWGIQLDKQLPLFGARREPYGALAMGREGNQILLCSSDSIYAEAIEPASSSLPCTERIRRNTSAAPLRR